MEPIVKAIYLLFLNHPEGIVFKHLPDYRKEVVDIYQKIKPLGLTERIIRSIEDVTNPLLNSINEKCSRIRAAFQAVVDPTLLLDKEIWEEAISDLKSEVDEKYIFAYVIAPNKEYLKIVNDLSKKTGLKVVHCGLTNPGYNNVKESFYTEDPLTFIKLIKNAEYVVTTSFHATVFSIIFNKKFFIIPHKKTGTRVTSLLEKLNIKDRIFYSLDEFEKINYDDVSDWKVINKALENEREKSINWLKDAIER